MVVTLVARIKEDPVILLQLFVAMMLLVGLTVMVLAFLGVVGPS